MPSLDKERAHHRLVILGLLLAFVGALLLLDHMSASPATLPRNTFRRLGPPPLHTRHTRVLLWTQQRSGSTLTSNLLCLSPSTFCTLEPLRRREEEGSTLLRDILECHFSERLKYFDDWMHGPQMNDLRVRELCQDPFDTLCETPDILETICRSAFVNIIKVAAVALVVGAPLLQETRLKTRMIHLVRDPRALVASRLLVEEGRFVVLYKGTIFTPEQKDPKAVCDRYRQDLTAAHTLARRYPQRYRLVRYEDIALHPHTEVHRLYAFLGLPYTATVASVVSKLTMGFFTKELEEHPFSTAKNSTSTVFAWRRRLPFSQVEEIQRECGDVLQAYGYRLYHSRLHYEDDRDSPLLPLPPVWAASLPGEKDAN